MPPAFQIPEKVKHILHVIGLTLWIYLAIQLVVSGTLSAIFSILEEIGITSPDLMQTLVLLVVTSLSAGIAFYAGMTSTNQTMTRIRKPSHFWPVLLSSLAILYFFSTVSGLLQTAFNWLFEQAGLQIAQPEFIQETGPAGIFLELLTIGIAAPILEELYFRRFCYKSLAPYGKRFAAILSSLCFAGMHMNFAQGIPVFFFGLVFCQAYDKTDSLATPILLHMINNLLSCILMIWPDTSILLSWIIVILATAGLILLLRTLIRLQTHPLPKEPSWWSMVWTSPAFDAFGILFLILSIGAMWL